MKALIVLAFMLLLAACADNPNNSASGAGPNKNCDNKIFTQKDGSCN